jgi:hypothetical protein
MTPVANKSGRQSTARQVADRKARVAELRRAEQAKARRRRLFTYGGGGIAGSAIVSLVIVLAVTSGGSAKGEVMPAPVTGTATVEAPAKVVTDDSGIAGVVAYDSTGWPASLNNGPAADALKHSHVDGPVTYSVTPPVGGDHNANYMSCGVYDKPVPNERAVHNLEHGAVWITYRPSLSAADVQTLRDFVKKQSIPTLTAGGQTASAGERFVDLSPWKDDTLPAPVVISSWGHQLQLQTTTDARLQKFVDVFRKSSKYTPEYTSACSGTPVSVGGRPLFS